MILTLIHNITLLVALSVIWSPILTLRKNYPNTYRILSGLLFGFSAIAAMMTPFHFEEDIIYDGRSVVIALAGLFGGGVVSFVASGVAVLYRIYLGGAGVYAGVASIIVSALLGLAMRRIYKNEPSEIPLWGIIVFAVVTHGMVLSCQILLPWPKGLTVIATIGVPYILVLSSGLIAIALVFTTVEKRTLALQHLQAGADLLQDVLSVSPSVAFIMNPVDNTISWVSPNVEIVLGYTPDEMMHANWFEESIHEDDISQYYSLFDTLTIENFSSVECRVYDKFKAIKWVDIHLHAVRNDDGIINALFGSLSDITQRRQIAIELEESEERYRTIFKNSKAMMLIIDPDDGSIVDANDMAVQYYGWTKDELLSMNIHQINTLPPDEIKARIEEARTCKRVYFEFRHRKKDGSIADVDVYSSAITIKGKQYLFSIVNDVTAKRQAELSLKKSEELFRLIFDNAPVGIYAFDAHGVITACNDNFITIMGSTRQALIGFDTLKLPDEKIVKATKRCLQGEQAEYRDWYKSVAANKVTPLRVFYSPLIVEDTVVGGLAIVEDLSQQIDAEKQKEKLEEQLRQAQKLEAIGRLVGGIAHDFNNILSIISGYAALIKFKIDRDNIIYPDIEEIVHAARRSADIVKQLLTFTRQQKVNPVRVNPNEIIKTSNKMLAAMIGENIKMQLELAEDIYDIWVDSGMFIQILTNLASNARDAIKDIGTIKIVTQNKFLDDTFCETHPGCKPGDYAMIQCIDDGSGMDKDTLERLFEPFFTTKEVGKGTGLGLSTVYGIMKQFSGHITVYSEYGQGTVVNIFFPKYTEQIPEIPEISAIENTTKTITVLHNKIIIVEDDTAILGMLQRMLLLLNQDIIAFNDPVDALNAVDAYKDFTILITDVIMPEMNGVELYDKLRQIIHNLKVIFISGYSNDAFNDIAFNIENSYFLQKPFTFEDLKMALHTISIK